MFKKANQNRKILSKWIEKRGVSMVPFRKLIFGIYDHECTEKKHPR